MAEVYLARHGELSGFKTLLVVKKVLPHLASNPEFIAMFLDEARIASLLDHPNVVRIYEVGKTGEEYFLAMELVQGKPLSSVLRRAVERNEGVNAKVAALIIAHAAAGLHHAHQLADADGHTLGLVHRDVSPQNVLISFEGSVKVIDFGIARALGRLSDTSTGGMKGKFGYMSPEQARGEEVDRRTDIFALGVVLWEAVCGRRLFTRDTDFATMRAIVYDPVPRPSTVAKVSPMLETVIMKALARDAAGRFQSAQEMAAALERCIFQSGGASAADIAGLMKTYFAEDQLKWRTTARIALDMEEDQPVTVPEIKQSHTDISKVTLPVPAPGAPGMPGLTAAASPPTVPDVLGTATDGTTERSKLAPQPPLRRYTPLVVAAAVLVGAMVVLLIALRQRPAPVVAPAPPAPAARATIEPLPAPRPSPTTPAKGAMEGAAGPAAATDETTGEPARPRTRKRRAGAAVGDETAAPASETKPEKPAGGERRPNPF